MLFQHIIVRVQLLIFFLQSVCLGFSLNPEPVVHLKLLSHLLKFLLFVDSDVLDLLKLEGLLLDRLLQITDMQ